MIRRDETWAVVPIKSRQHCKTRLAAEMDEKTRLNLVRHMLDHVVATLRACDGIDNIVVLSPERDTLACDIEVMAETGTDFNSSLADAMAALSARGARQVLVVPSDLPHLGRDDLEALLAEEGIALAPDEQGRGTNAIGLPANLSFRFAFNRNDSFAGHWREALRHRVPVRQVQSPGLAFDLDSPEDLERYLRQNNLSLQTLKTVGVPS